MVLFVYRRPVKSILRSPKEETGNGNFVWCIFKENLIVYLNHDHSITGLFLLEHSTVVQLYLPYISLMSSLIFYCRHVQQCYSNTNK